MKQNRLTHFIVILLALTMTIQVIPANAITIVQKENILSEETVEKNYCDATLEDDFTDDCVLVVMKKNYGGINKIHSKEKFKGVEIESVEDLTNITGNIEDKGIDVENYRQILKITLKNKSKKEVLKGVKAFEKLDEVEYAEPNYIYSLNMESEENVDYEIDESEATDYINSTEPNDTNYYEQYGLSRIDASDAWEITKGTKTVKVGVIDSGICAHPDINANLTTGWDFYNNNNVTTDDIGGHGTHVAGIIGAVGNNNLGVTGVCWNVTLVPLQVADETGRFPISSFVAALEYATNNNIDIVNYSAGGDYNESQKTAIENYPGLFVCSAGNDGKNTDNSPAYPSSLSYNNIISVANSTSSGNLSNSSNYGKTSVDLAAPGTYIKSTYLNNGYAELSGTSMAAPFVTGVAALIKSIRSDLSAYQIKNCILDGVNADIDLQDLCVSGGILNAYKAVSLAVNYSAFTGDFNGDGKDDVVKIVPISATTEDPNNKVAMFVTEPDISIPTCWGKYSQFTLSKTQGRRVIGDFNGDGMDDIAFMYNYGNKQPKILVFKSNGYSFGESWETWYTETGTFKPDSVKERFTAGDFNGDGKDDIAAMYGYADNTTKILVFTSNGSSFNHWEAWYTQNTPGNYNADKVTGRFKAGDFNGDGKDDIAAMYAYSSGITKIHVFRSKGTSFTGFETWYTQETPGEYDTSKVSDRFTVGDFNNDGKDDISTMYDNDSDGTDIHVFKSNGTSFNSWQSWKSYSASSFSMDNLCGFVAGDVDGDKMSDLILRYKYGRGPTYLLKLKSSGSSFLAQVKFY